MAGEFLTFPKMPCTGESDAATWVALEKIHGAQLVIDADRDGIRFGKRKGWLAEDEPFFGWQLLRGTLRDAARAAFKRVGGSRLILYGELFGGGYPHPEVPNSGLVPVQTGVWYAPDLRWALFEARVLDGELDDFLSWTDASALAKAAGLAMPPLIARGRKVEIDKVSERFSSRAAQELGYPALGGGNLAEGLVLKPDVRMPADAYTSSKRKIAEMREDRFDESQPWDPNRPVSFERLSEWAEKLVNAPRIASAASKVGRHDAKKMADEIVLDVLQDLEEAFPGAMAALGVDGWAALEKAVRARIPPSTS